MASWTEEDAPLRLIEQTVARRDPDPKALACYGLLVRQWDAAGERDERMLLRFVDGRPISAGPSGQDDAIPRLVQRTVGGTRENGVVAGLG